MQLYLSDKYGIKLSYQCIYEKLRIISERYTVVRIIPYIDLGHKKYS